MYFDNDQDPLKLELLDLIGRKNIKYDDLSTLSEDEFKRILLNPKTYITECRVDDNNYGKFLFIFFTIGKIEYFVYGLGFHEQRQKLINKNWEFTISTYNVTPNKSEIEAEKVFKAIKERKIAIKDLKVQNK